MSAERVQLRMPVPYLIACIVCLMAALIAGLLGDFFTMGVMAFFGVGIIVGTFVGRRAGSHSLHRWICGRRGSRALVDLRRVHRREHHPRRDAWSRMEPVGSTHHALAVRDLHDNLVSSDPRSHHRRLRRPTADVPSRCGRVPGPRCRRRPCARFGRHGGSIASRARTRPRAGSSG
jgi:hypothetical protein